MRRVPQLEAAEVTIFADASVHLPPLIPTPHVIEIALDTTEDVAEPVESLVATTSAAAEEAPKKEHAIGPSVVGTSEELGEVADTQMAHLLSLTQALDKVRIAWDELKNRPAAFEVYIG